LSAGCCKLRQIFSVTAHAAGSQHCMRENSALLAPFFPVRCGHCQVQDTASRTALSTLLLRCACAEVVAPHASLSAATLACLSRYSSCAAAAADAAAPTPSGRGAQRGLLSCLPKTSFPSAYVPPSHTSKDFGSSSSDLLDHDSEVSGDLGRAQQQQQQHRQQQWQKQERERLHDGALQQCAALLQIDALSALAGGCAGRACCFSFVYDYRHSLTAQLVSAAA